jgi:hypothetical protein
LLAAALVAAQSRIIKAPSQTNSGNSSKRQHVATLRSSDSPEGSRVALSSDQSLNDYEAYRRGDRFYVKIPAADVPRAEAIRGRGFADVKAQRRGDSTIVSFRLQPGATAHVEQRSNRLDVVFTVPGDRAPEVAANRSRELRSNSSPESNKNSNANKRNASSPSTNNNAADRSKSATTRGSALTNSNSNTKTGSTTSTTDSGSKPTPTPLSSPRPSPTAKLPSPTPSQKSSTVPAGSPVSSSATPPAQSRDDAWTRMKERAHYWILLAQLNPVPVATGAGVLFILLVLFLFQRRRAKATRGARPGRTKSRKTKTAAGAAPGVQPSTEVKPEPVANSSLAEAAIGTAVVAAAASSKEEIPEVIAAPPVADVPAPVSVPADDARQERVVRATQEAKNLFAGGDYDQSVIGSDDRETRQLVGAELLSAMVGRNVPRRERAREAFMKHGYFDDATRDLRIAESPNERAAAARRLSFVHDREATPHLIGALDDPAPDVRRAAVEALMDLRDPAAIGPLNSLMQTENDRQVPRTVIKHAIEACATSAPEEVSSVAAPNPAPAPIPETSSQPVETEREVIEL